MTKKGKKLTRFSRLRAYRSGRTSRRKRPKAKRLRSLRKLGVGPICCYYEEFLPIDESKRLLEKDDDLAKKLDKLRRIWNEADNADKCSGENKKKQARDNFVFLQHIYLWECKGTPEKTRLFSRGMSRDMAMYAEMRLVFILMVK